MLQHLLVLQEVVTPGLCSSAPPGRHLPTRRHAQTLSWTCGAARGGTNHARLVPCSGPQEKLEVLGCPRDRRSLGTGPPMEAAIIHRRWSASFWGSFGFARPELHAWQGLGEARGVQPGPVGALRTLLAARPRFPTVRGVKRCCCHKARGRAPSAVFPSHHSCCWLCSASLLGSLDG